MASFPALLKRLLTPPAKPSGPKAIDLFSGAGGLTIGMRAAGVRTICAVEMEPYRLATFIGHTRGAEVLATDVRTVDFTTYCGRADLIYGGPPCQPFSSGGLRKASNDGRDMIPEFVRAVREVVPRAFLMENVPGLLAADRMDYFSGVIQQLQTCGYSVNWKIVNAADFGAPQKRRRLFVVGLRNRTFDFPTETHGPDRDFPRVAVKAALPKKPVGEPNPTKIFYAKNPDLRPSPYDGHPFNGGGRPIDPDQPSP
jgi:DNA (cytosine-5)-methyltransferase 1